MIWLFESCLRARTYLLGPITCLTLPKVPAPKVWMHSYWEMSLGYFEEMFFLDLDWFLSPFLCGSVSSFSLYFCNFYSLFNSTLNSYCFIWRFIILINIIKFKSSTFYHNPYSPSTVLHLLQFSLAYLTLSQCILPLLNFFLFFS